MRTEKWPGRTPTFSIPQRLLWILAALSLVLTSSCQQRKPSDIDTNVPQDKNGYTPVTTPGGGPTPGSQEPNGPASLGNSAGNPADAQLLNGWAGTADLLVPGWTLTDVPATQAPGPTPPPPGGGNAPPPSSPPAPSAPGANNVASVTFGKDIKPLMDKYCVSCHAVGQSRAASPLTSYPSASLAAQSATKVANGSMPKAGSPQMTAAEKDLFARWAANKYAP